MVEEEPGQKDEEVGQEDTLLRKKLVRLTIGLGAVLAVALLVSLGFALRWYLSPQTDLSISQRQALVQGLASAGQAVAVLLTGAVALIGLYLTRQNTNKQLRQARESTREQLEQARESTREQLEQARESQERTQASAQETLRLTEQGQITERFTRAIEQLGATDDKGEMKLEIRLGGIYALERIAWDSPERDYSTVMEVLTAYVRENARWPPPNSKVEPISSGAPPTDIQAILTVIARRTGYYGNGETEPLDLQGTNLRGSSALGSAAEGRAVHLESAFLLMVNFIEADLQDAFLQGAKLQGANLYRAKLQGANLQGANLQDAYLRGANLQGANLLEADLTEANLRDTTVTDEQLADTLFLQGATMPNGQKYEDWLKDKEGRK